MSKHPYHSVSLDHTTYLRLKELAEQEDRTISSLVRVLMKQATILLFPIHQETLAKAVRRG